MSTFPRRGKRVWAVFDVYPAGWSAVGCAVGAWKSCTCTGETGGGFRARMPGLGRAAARWGVGVARRAAFIAIKNHGLHGRH